MCDRESVLFFLLVVPRRKGCKQNNNKTKNIPQSRSELILILYQGTLKHLRFATGVHASIINRRQKKMNLGFFSPHVLEERV